MFHIVLYQPEIPPNTGNIMRLCANTDFALHLIEPLGFDVTDKAMRRAGMDYLARTSFNLYPNIDEFFTQHDLKRVFLCTTKAQHIYTDNTYQAGDVFVFGPETRGLPIDLLEKFSTNQKIKIPMTANGRSLNLANSVSIVVYEAWRQLGFATSV